MRRYKQVNEKEFYDIKKDVDRLTLTIVASKYHRDYTTVWKIKNTEDYREYTRRKRGLRESEYNRIKDYLKTHTLAETMRWSGHSALVTWVNRTDDYNEFKRLRNDPSNFSLYTFKGRGTTADDNDEWYFTADAMEQAHKELEGGKDETF